MKTVKEVMEITGLSRKIINDYHNEGIIMASRTRNRGHESRRGKSKVKVDIAPYKEYDEEAVIKFQQVAIYKALKMKRKDIKAKITAPDYDSNKVLDEQIQLLKEEIDNLERLIELAEGLKAIGINKKLYKKFAIPKFEQIMLSNDVFEHSKYYQAYVKTITDANIQIDFTNHFEMIARLTEEDLNSKDVKNILKDLFTKQLGEHGFFGYLILIGISMCVEGEGEVVTELELSPIVGKAIGNHIQQEIKVFLESFLKLLDRHEELLEMDFSNAEIPVFVEESKKLLFQYFGIKYAEELEFIEDVLKINREESDDYIDFLFKLIKQSMKRIDKEASIWNECQQDS